MRPITEDKNMSICAIPSLKPPGELREWLPKVVIVSSDAKVADMPSPIMRGGDTCPNRFGAGARTGNWPSWASGSAVGGLTPPTMEPESGALREAESREDNF